MIQCESCQRHHRPDEATCPFCRRPSRVRSTLSMIGGALTTVVLAACYGAPGGFTDTGLDTGPPTPDTGAPDEDGDGFRADVDCDDANPNVNPDATEICDDGIDNDCDGLIDGDDPECDV